MVFESEFTKFEKFQDWIKRFGCIAVDNLFYGLRPNADDIREIERVAAAPREYL
jgi:hypothetical protein